MTLETGSYIGDFHGGASVDYPEDGSNMSEGDDAIRQTKQMTYNTFPNCTGAVTISHTIFNYMVGVQQNLSTIYQGTTSGLADIAVATKNYSLTTGASITLAAGMRFTFMANGANTGASPTLEVDANGTKIIKYADGTTVGDGEILDNMIVEVIYDGTDFRWLV